VSIVFVSPWMSEAWADVLGVAYDFVRDVPQDVPDDAGALLLGNPNFAAA
jgi:hypothetical protein